MTFHDSGESGRVEKWEQLILFSSDTRSYSRPASFLFLFTNFFILVNFFRNFDDFLMIFFRNFYDSIVLQNVNFIIQIVKTID